MLASIGAALAGAALKAAFNVVMSLANTDFMEGLIVELLEKAAACTKTGFDDEIVAQIKASLALKKAQ